MVLFRAQQLLSGKRREAGEGSHAVTSYQSAYPTCFAAALRDLQPPLPPNLVRGLARRKTPDNAIGKVSTRVSYYTSVSVSFPCIEHTR